MYTIFKIAAALALKIYCKKTVANFKEPLRENVPTIMASNHPNSFFDAIVIAVHYPKPIYFLARGDAFKKPLVAKFLNSLHLIPIYRLSEGKENLNKNTTTFETCISLLKQKRTILIFSEGICVNEWNLRPLKKGTARLALMALHKGINNLKIQPTNLNYSSFDNNPKEVEINFNSSFVVNYNNQTKESSFYNSFNAILKTNILKGMIVKKDLKDISLFGKTKSRIYKALIAAPALIGFIANSWFYNYFKKIAQTKTKSTVFYDSVLFGMLLLFYPTFIIALSIAATVLFNFKIGLLLFVAMPLTGWFYKEYKTL